MKSSRSRLVRAASALALATVATLSMSACSGAGPGVAAVTDGQVIHETDLDAIASDFAKVPGAQAPSRVDMVSILVARPYVMQALGGNSITEQGVRQLLGKELPEVSDATVRYIQGASSQQRLDQAAAARVQQAMTTADIEVDPRYGTFDPSRGLVPAAPNWLVPAETAVTAP